MHKKGPTNRVGREETKPLSYITLSSQKVPGPGRYTPAKSTDAPSWSMRAKVADDSNDINSIKYSQKQHRRLCLDLGTMTAQKIWTNLENISPPNIPTQNQRCGTRNSRNGSVDHVRKYPMNRKQHPWSRMVLAEKWSVQRRRLCAVEEHIHREEDHPKISERKLRGRKTQKSEKY